MNNFHTYSPSFMGAQNFNHFGENQEGLLARGIQKVRKIEKRINDTTGSARRAALAVTLAAGALLGGTKMIPEAGATEVLALTQGGDNTVTLINPSSSTTIQEVTLPGGSSARGGGVVVSETMNAVYVANRNGTSSSVSEFADLTSAVRTDDVTVSNDTYDLVEDSSINTLVGITNNEVYTVDETTMSLNGTSSSVSGGDFTHLTLLTPGSEVAVSDWGNDQVQIFDISTSTPTLTNSWDMGGAGACGITLDENSGYLIVTGCDDNTINWVDPTTGSIENSISSPTSGYGSWQVIVDSSYNLWVTDQGVSEGDTNLTMLEDSDGDDFQETAMQTFAFGEYPVMTQFNGYIHLGTMQSSSEDWVMIDQSLYTYTELDISSFSGSPDYMGAGNITDVDGDGHDAEEDGGGDCDDLDATISPDATTDDCEDGVDQDCDGTDPSCAASTLDADGDGHDAIADGGDDCDDGDANINPDETEICGDGTDQDCSSDPDDGTTDADGDSFIDEACTGGDDCDDGDATAFPGGTETAYDGIDQDCDGSDLEDADGDGHNSTVVGGDDCDDGNANVNPDETEVCGDGTDNDCIGGDETCPPGDEDGDGVTDDVDECAGSTDYASVDSVGCDDFQRDSDEDGYMDGDDCDPEDDTIHPGAEDACDDGVDSDCDTIDPECPPNQDVDGDGYIAEAYAGDDCNDENANINPGEVDDYDAAMTDDDCNSTANDYGTGAISILNVSSGGNQFSITIEGSTITIAQVDGTSIEWERIDPTWTINQELTEFGALDLGADGSRFIIEYDTDCTAHITTIEPSGNIHNRETNEVFATLTEAGQTATVEEGTGDIYMDTDGDGQEELVHDGNPDLENDDTGGDDTDETGDNDDTDGGNHPVSPDCGGCDFSGQNSPAGVAGVVNAAISLALRRRRSDKKAAK